MFGFIYKMFNGADNSEEEDLSSSSSFSSLDDSLELEGIIIEELKKVNVAPFIANLKRRDSVADLNGLKDHRNIITNVVELPEDHASYQEQTKARIKEKVEGWKDGGELTEEEQEVINVMLSDEGDLKFGVLDTEEFIDSIRDYLHFKKEHGEYSEEEKLVNAAANTITELLLDREELYKPENVVPLLAEMNKLRIAIDAVGVPKSLKWVGVKAKVDALYEEVERKNVVSAKNALEMQSLMASWPPSLDSRLLENKSRVNTKILTRSKEMDLFDMPIKDLMLREASKKELEALNKAMTKTHSIQGEAVVLRPEDINATIREFRESYNKLNEAKQGVYLKYGKDLEEFVAVLNSLKADSAKGSTDKLKRQISYSGFQDAATKFKTALEDQNPQLEGMDKLITAVGAMIGDFEASGGTKRVEAAYKSLIKAIGVAPVTLSPSVLALTQAQEQSKHDKDSTWYRDDLFKTTKGLAEGCASIFEELNEYHKYINELNNFVLSLITVEDGESPEALESRTNIIKSLSIEAIEGSVKDITNWQSQGRTKTAIADIRTAIGALSGSDVPGALSTTMDALAGFKTAFDPISGRNFTKGSTTISGEDVATAARDTTYDNPLNPSNGKEAGKGIAIMKGSVDTLMALKTVVLEFTKPPGTKTLEKTIDLCEKWNNAILNLSFGKDVKNLTKNIDILSKYPKTSVAPSIKEIKTKTVKELQEEVVGFSLPNFKDTLKQRLLESIEEHFEDKTKNLERFYALRFSELLKIIKKEIEKADYSDKNLKVNYVDGMMGGIEESSYSEILTPLKKRYHDRIDKEIDWRETSGGKASNIETEGDFSKKTPITTHKDAKKQGAPKIAYYISEVAALEKKISDSTKSMDVQIFLPNVNPTQFGVFANAGTKEAIDDNKKRYRDTFQNIIEKSETAALPTVLKSMKTTAKVADGIDMMSSSFVQASRILTSIVPDNDMSEENFQVGAKKWQAVINLVGTAASTAASITAAFVGPYAPIPLLIGGVVKGITSAINLIIGQRIKASEAKEYIDKFIVIFEKASSVLQEVRNKVSGHRESLQGWLEEILNAIANIEKYELA